ETHVEVARLAALRIGRAAAAQPQALAALTSRRHLELYPSLERRHRDGGAPNGLHDRDGHVHHEVLALALEPRRRAHVHDEVEVARLATVVAGAPFSGDPDAGAVGDAGRNLDVELLARLDRSGAAARGTGAPPDAPRAVAGGAGRGPPDRDRGLRPAQRVEQIDLDGVLDVSP